MAFYRGDGRQALEQAVKERDHKKKVELVIDALNLHFREMEHVMQNLGVENFGELGLREIREG